VGTPRGVMAENLEFADWFPLMKYGLLDGTIQIREHTMMRRPRDRPILRAAKSEALPPNGEKRTMQIKGVARMKLQRLKGSQVSPLFPLDSLGERVYPP
jgi:hypothetical protein